MQHLDDALIAEWVDGEVPADSPRHAAIASHVEQCDECRARVEEERALAGHVRQLLGVAAPPERVPPFEEVLHRAGGTPRGARRAGIPWRRLAWAATVVVAGGVGWYARELTIASGSDAPTTPAPVVMRELAAPTEAARAEATSAPAEPVPSAVGGAAQRQEAPTAGRAAQAAASEEIAADRADVERLGVRRDAAVPAAPAAAEPRPLAQMAAPAENELRMQKVAAGPWIGTTRAAAERVLGHPLLVVDGLAITRVELAADSSVRVRQDLGDGTALDLVQSRAATRVAAEAVADAAAEPRERLARAAPPAVDTVVDGVRVVLSAPVSADSLRVLLSKLRR
jgi:hypothetical protein